MQQLSYLLSLGDGDGGTEGREGEGVRCVTWGCGKRGKQVSNLGVR